MTVCSCNEVDFDMIVLAVEKHGDDIEMIMEETEAGTTCECCQEEDCDIVDLPLPLAIRKARELIEKGSD